MLITKPLVSKVRKLFTIHYEHKYNIKVSNTSPLLGFVQLCRSASTLLTLRGIDALKVFLPRI